MIILVQPMYSKRELNADSNYVVYTSLIRGFHEAGLPHHFVVIFPDDKSGFRYDPDGFFSLPNVTRVPQRISPRKMSNAVTFDGVWYDRLLRRFGFDIVWCNLVEIAAQIKYAGDSTYGRAARPVMIAAHNYVIHRTLPYVMDSMEHVLWAQLMGAVNADVNVFNSDHCQAMLLEEARDRLGAASIAKIEASAVRLDYGPLEEDLPVVAHDVDLPVIAYNHRLQGYKQWRVTFDLLAELWEEGIRFRVRYMNNTSEKTSAIRKLPFVEIVLCSNRTDYLAALAGCHLNVTNSPYETFCISALESMAMGQPLVAPNGVTFPQITGRTENGYPYLFDDLTAQKRMLRELLTDSQARAKAGATVREHVKASYGRRLWVDRYASLFSEARLEHGLSVNPDLLKKTQALIAGYGKAGVLTRSFYNDLTKLRINGKQKVSNQSFPLAKVIRLARVAGGRVNFRRGEQVISSA